MITRLCCLLVLSGVVSAQVPPAPERNRMTIKPDVLDLPRCVAQPGNVPLLLGPGVNLEIVDWAAAPAATNHTGEFMITFTTNAASGTLFTYDASEVFYSAGETWKPLPASPAKKRRLEVRPFPGDQPVRTLKITVPAKHDAAKQDAPYRATLPFAMVVPVRVIDIAKDARVTANFGPGSPIRELTDGVIDPQKNFTLSRPTPLIGSNLSPWILLSWDQTQSVRGLAFYSGRGERGLADNVIEGCVSTNEPRLVTNPADWQTPTVRMSDPGQFRSNQFAVVMHELYTRGIRIRNTNTSGEIGLGEILLLTSPPRPSGSTSNASPAVLGPVRP